MKIALNWMLVSSPKFLSWSINLLGEGDQKWDICAVMGLEIL